MIRRLLFCLTLLGLASQAGAGGDTPLKRLNTGDDSRGWEAVGRLDMNGRAFCTGALIAPDLVLTAAHCLFDKETGARFDATGIEFRAGWRNGRAEAYRDVARAVIHPDYDFGSTVATERVRNDLALLELSQPIRNTQVQPFETMGRSARGAKVGVVSYAHDRANAPSLQELCGVIGQQEGVLITSCTVDFGSSGAPIFSFEDGHARIVSVVSAKAEIKGSPVALGTDLQLPLATLMAELANSGGHFLNATPRDSRFSAGGQPRDTGAKFVRP